MVGRLLCGVLVGVLCLLAFMVSVKAEDTTPQCDLDYRLILNVTVALADGVYDVERIGMVPPTVRYEPNYWFADHLCQPGEPCMFPSAYDAEDHEVVLNQDLLERAPPGAVCGWEVHEIVHAIQRAAGVDVKYKPSAREYQAASYQWAFLRLHAEGRVELFVEDWMASRRARPVEASR